VCLLLQDLLQSCSGGVCVYYCRTYYATGTIYNTAGDQTDLFGSLPCLGPSSAIKKNRSDFGFRFVVKWSPTTLTTANKSILYCQITLTAKSYWKHSTAYSSWSL
jgi:hypothetical protein